MSQDRFSNPKYMDWVKVKLSLQYAREGLGPMTEDKVKTFHEYLCSKLQSPSSSSAYGGPVTCNSCLKVELKKQWSSRKFKCIGGICDRWLEQLQKNHVKFTSTVNLDKLDVSKLPLSPWECAKVYIPHGSGKIKCVKDADLAAILTLYQHCQYLSSDLQDVSLCKRVIEVRNTLLHSGTMEVTHDSMQADIKLVKQLLNDRVFVNDKYCREAVTKIDQLLSGKIELSLNKELELCVLNADIKHVAVNTQELRQSMDDLTDQVQQQCGQLGTEVSDVTKDVSSLKDKLKAAVDNISELQRFAKPLQDFINAYRIDRVDIEKLDTSMGTLATLKAETSKQNQKLAELEETVGRHEATLKQYGGKLQQHEGMLEQQKRRLDSFDSIESDSSAKRSRSEPDIGEIESLQQYLIDVYEKDCKWENPLTSDVDSPISKMYVKPEIKLVRQRDQKQGLINVPQKHGNIETMRQIFYTDKEQCQNIYITGNAGMGKTTFCKYLVDSWCKVKQGIANEREFAEEFGLLKEFSLLFYVNLREVESQYLIKDMIETNILHNATGRYNVSDILKTEKCLIVLDGLDEWSCPQDAEILRGLNKDIPGRNTLNKKCTYITTTRNWKFETINLMSKDCDKHLEICGIGKNSSNDLANKTVCQLGAKHKKPISDFFVEVQDKSLTTLTNVPILLIHLVTLWYFSKDFGKSQVQLYCKMLDLLFEQAKKNLPGKKSTLTKPVQRDAQLPKCFSKEETNCHNNKQLILCLSKLAFISLLNTEKEDSLVFKSSSLEIFGFDESDINLCLKCGIFTQTKYLYNPMGRYKKYSFIHKKLQEFLAAVHLVSRKSVKDDMGKIREYCSTLDTTLEMGQVFIFVCGMKADLGNQLLKHQRCVVSNDKFVQNYRQSIYGESLIRDIQACVMACITEGASNELTIDLHLQDYSIDRDTMSDYVNFIEQKKMNVVSIKSVYIFTNECSEENVTEVLEHLQKVETLEKFWMRDLRHVVPEQRSILAAIINNNVRTLKSLCLGRVDLLHQEVFPAVLNCIPYLRALWLGEVWLLGDVYDSHGQIKSLVKTNTSHLKQLCLELKCPEHKEKCRALLDLSEHTQLQTLDLKYMCVTNLHAVAKSVENVDLWHLTVAQSILRQFIEALEQTSQKVDVELNNVTVTEDNGGPVDLAAYLLDCDKFIVEECDIGPDNVWDCVRFHKK